MIISIYPVFETIKVVDGVYHNLDVHVRRMKLTSNALFGKEISIKQIEFALSLFNEKGLYKCNIFYNHVDYEISYKTYQRITLSQAELIPLSSNFYPYKYTDRQLFSFFEKKRIRGMETIFVINNLLTDAVYSNLALWNGKSWHTPKTPMLLGTKRHQLLAEGILEEANIAPTDLKNYQKISLINAMNELGEIELPVEQVYNFNE
jgi:hypothetical protein